MNIRMRKTLWKIGIPVGAAIVLVVVLLVAGHKRASDPMISVFGKYQGYSQPVYDGTQRSSEYLTLSDGTRLAYDLIIPTRKGVLADHPLPVFFKYTPYGRAWTIFGKKGEFLLAGVSGIDWKMRLMLRVRYLLAGARGRIFDPLFRDRWLGNVVKHGYIVVSVERPGTGASFSSPTPGNMDTAARFESEILDWIAAQPWSNGNIGMYGDSQQAMVQLAAAAAGNPHLKAIMPAASSIEIYDAVDFPGGVFNKGFDALVARMLPLLDALVTPVDSDSDGLLLAEALRQRVGAVSVQSVVESSQQCPFRDSAYSNGLRPWEVNDLYPLVDRINRSRTPIYLSVGWYDVFTADTFYWYNNLTVPKRLTVRPTDHSNINASLADLDYGTEALRWFDYWLKGIDNGIMDEPPLHYFVQEDAKKGTWQTSNTWPLATQNLTTWYLGPGNSGSVASVNDGTMVIVSPAAAAASDAYTVDYRTTTGTKSRWVAIEEEHSYPDLRANDAKALTYTTVPLRTDMEVTGHPVAHLWLTTDAPDLDAFVYLEVVDASGRSTYLTEGDLRASHRSLSAAPFNTFGLPYHSHLRADYSLVPVGEPFELRFSLLPTSYRVRAGSRLRITVAFADADNFDTPRLTPAPRLQLLRDVGHPSLIEIPVVQRS